jgi:hypothetical protein
MVGDVVDDAPDLAEQTLEWLTMRVETSAFAAAGGRPRRTSM